MIISIKTDQEIVKLFMKEPNVYLYDFTERIRKEIFDAIQGEVDSLNKSGRAVISKKIIITDDEQRSILEDFARSLLKDEGKELKGFLRPKGIVREETADGKTEYHIANSSDLPDSAPSCEQPKLSVWVKVKKMRYYVQAKIIFNGIMLRNLMIVQAFVKGKDEPTLMPMISNFVFIYGIADAELTDQRSACESVANTLISSLTGDDKTRERVAKFRFKGPIINYFRIGVLKDFFSEYVGLCDNTNMLKTDIALKEQIKELGYTKMEMTELLEILPTSTTKRRDTHISIDSEEISIVAEEPDSYADEAERLFLERVFKIMEKNGKKIMADVLRMELKKNEGLIESDKTIADLLQMSVENVRTIKSRGKDEIERIAALIKKDFF